MSWDHCDDECKCCDAAEEEIASLEAELEREPAPCRRCDRTVLLYPDGYCSERCRLGFLN